MANRENAYYWAGNTGCKKLQCSSSSWYDMEKHCGAISAEVIATSNFISDLITNCHYNYNKMFTFRFQAQLHCYLQHLMILVTLVSWPWSVIVRFNGDMQNSRGLIATGAFFHTIKGNTTTENWWKFILSTCMLYNFATEWPRTYLHGIFHLLRPVKKWSAFLPQFRNHLLFFKNFLVGTEFLSKEFWSTIRVRNNSVFFRCITADCIYLDPVNKLSIP